MLVLRGGHEPLCELLQCRPTKKEECVTEKFSFTHTQKVLVSEVLISIHDKSERTLRPERLLADAIYCEDLFAGSMLNGETEKTFTF